MSYTIHKNIQAGPGYHLPPISTSNPDLTVLFMCSHFQLHLHKEAGLLFFTRFSGCTHEEANPCSLCLTWPAAVQLISTASLSPTIQSNSRVNGRIVKNVLIFSHVLPLTVAGGLVRRPNWILLCLVKV